MAPTAKLFAKYGRLAGTQVTVANEVTIGRNESNTVVVPSRAASGDHARIVYEASEDLFFLEDLGSLNGTWLDGVPIEGREKLGRLHVISIAGRHDLIYQGPQLEAAAPTAAQPASQPVAQPVSQAGEERPERERTVVQQQAVPLPAALAQQPERRPEGERTRIGHEAVPLPAALAGPPEQAPTPMPPATAQPVGQTSAAHFYVVFTNYQSGLRLELAAGDNVVGRGPSNQVQIDSPEISRRHAVLTVRGTTVTLRDEGSHNSTFLDGVQVDGEVEVSPGAILRFGTIEAQLVRVDR